MKTIKTAKYIKAQEHLYKNLKEEMDAKYNAKQELFPNEFVCYECLKINEEYGGIGSEGYDLCEECFNAEIEGEQEAQAEGADLFHSGRYQDHPELGDYEDGERNDAIARDMRKNRNRNKNKNRRPQELGDFQDYDVDPIDY